MRGGRASRYTVFDVLDAKGFFELNSANSSSPQYTGPVQYPKMFYHPLGKTRVIQKAEILQTPFGPQKVGEQWELIARTVSDADEEKRARAAGWHDHPAKAIAAGGSNAPPMASHSRIAALERQLADVTAQLNAARAAPPPPVDEFAIEGVPDDTHVRRRRPKAEAAD